MSKLFCAGIALLVAAGITLSADSPAKKGDKHNVAFGKVAVLEIKDGVGHLTILTQRGKEAEMKEMKFVINKDTKLVKEAGKGTEGTAVAAAQVSETYHKDAPVAVRFEGTGNNLTATRVNANPRKGPDAK